LLLVKSVPKEPAKGKAAILLFHQLPHGMGRFSLGKGYTR